MPSAEFRLGLRTLYIVPSRFGMVWLATAALLLVVAIQTASNSTFLIAFVLLGLMFLAMFLTHDNLQGITLRCGGSSPGFASDKALCSLRLCEDGSKVSDSDRLGVLP